MKTPTPEMPRLGSLDAFRGFAIAGMLLVNNPGDWAHLHAPLAHASWNGWTFTDTVFPFFLFAAGVAMAISIERRRATGSERLVPGLAARAAVIFAVGLALNLVPSFDFATVRIPGVLQRIALCILVAAPLAVHARTRTIVGATAALFAAYTVLMLLVPVPGPDGVVAAGVLEPGRDFGAWLDRLVFGRHLWSQSRTWDPEGLTSTLPAVASLLFGVVTGRALLHAPEGLRPARAMLTWGAIAVAVGMALDRVLMPINKNLWTPSYSVFMTGLALVVFAAFHAAMDSSPSERVRTTARRLALPLTILGMNALFIFALSGLVGRLMGTLRIDGAALKAHAYAPISRLPLSAENTSLAYAVCFWLAMFAVAWLMWRRRWFVKA
jgi:predicted acyltransferase